MSEATIVRTKHAPAFKTKVALEAIKQQLTFAEISSSFKIHTTQITKWKQAALAAIESAFTGKVVQREKDVGDTISALHETIGKLTVENDWLKKKIGIIDSRVTSPRS